MTMKRLFVLALLGLFTCGVVFAQPKQTDKDLWKMAKKKAKEYTADGWKIDDARMLENVLYLYYKKLQNEANQPLVSNVVGTDVKSLNKAQQWASTNASTSYAKQAKREIMGRIANEVGDGEAGAPSAEFFYEGYESKLKTEINGQLKKKRCFVP